MKETNKWLVFKRGEPDPCHSAATKESARNWCFGRNCHAIANGNPQSKYEIRKAA